MIKRVLSFGRRLALTAVALGTMPATISAQPLAYAPMASASQATLVGMMAPVDGGGMDLAGEAGEGQAEQAENPCNPCAPTNPCNPCGAPTNPCNPCAPKNPCNPCAAKHMGMVLGSKDLDKLIAKGEALWNESELSTNGLSCQTCHANGMSMTPAESFPHYVAMPDRVVSLDQMINFCMINPMAASPFGWDDSRLTALAAYYTYALAGTEKPADRQPANPCGTANPGNPCAPKNPCNPCAPANPCGGVASPGNPCAPKNPCSPGGEADAPDGFGALQAMIALAAVAMFAGIQRVRP